MHSQTTLFQLSSFNFKVNHLIIIGVLILAFSATLAIRSQPAQYGNQLNEFDPFYNFRATQYLVENGFSEYFEWHDDKSWYPHGRNVSLTSQVMLHITAAVTYQIFEPAIELDDYIILFPAIIGSLTVVVIFALVRLFAGTTPGLIASLLFAVSLPIIYRGTVGWFKSEPLGLFYVFLGIYLFLSAIKSENKKVALVKIIFAGIVMAFSLSSWGGNQFLIIPMGLFIIALPFVRQDHKFLLWIIPLFVGIFLAICSLFERPGLSFILGMGGVALIFPTLFLICSIFVQKISKNKIRNSFILLISIIIIGASVVILNDATDNLPLPSFRYLNALNPLLIDDDPLAASIAEHAPRSIDIAYLFHSTWMIFAGLGIWILLSKKIPYEIIANDMRIFVLIFGITAVYVGSSFIRLENFTSVSLIIFSSIALTILTKNILKIKSSGVKNYLIKISYIVIIIFLFTIPLIFPVDGGWNWIEIHDEPPTIFTGATYYGPTNDWLLALEWIKLNTPENAVIASWWDYGYWISTMSDRATIIDNATLETKTIQKMGKMFLSSPNDSWNILQEMGADYVVVFIAAEKINDNLDEKLYVLRGGGDESKVYPIAAISKMPLNKYYTSDGLSYSNYFFNETMMGKLIPFDTELYYNPQTFENSPTYKPGFMQIVGQKIDYNSDDDPLKLVYVSPSFIRETLGQMQVIVVYEVNKNYIP